MIFRRYSIRQALQTWGEGLSWLAAILVGWLFFGLLVQILEEQTITSMARIRSITWATILAVLIFGTPAAWLWICFRAVFSSQSTSKTALWLAVFGVGCWWLGASPLLDHSLTLGRSEDYRGESVYNLKHAAILLLVLGLIWIAHPLVHEIQWSQRRQAVLSPPKSVWLNRWVRRGMVIVPVAFAWKILAPQQWLDSSETWEYEFCQTDHLVLPLLAVSLLLVSFRITALVNRTWFQCVAWPLLLVGASVVAWFLLVYLELLESQFTLPLTLLLIAPSFGVLCFHLWFMNALGFRLVVPRVLNSSSTGLAEGCDRVSIDRRTMAFAYTGSAVALLSCLAGLTLLRNEVFIAAYFIESDNQRETSRVIAECQAWYRDFPITEADFLAYETRTTPIEYVDKKLIRMLVSRSLAAAPGWDQFRQDAEQEAPIQFYYLYPISNETEFSANIDLSLIVFDQAKRPLREYVPANSVYGRFPGKSIVVGGEVTDADLKLLPSLTMEFVSCQFPADTHFDLPESVVNREIVLRDCTIAPSAMAALASARTLQRTIIVTDHQRPVSNPDLLIDAVLHGIEVEFPNANREWLPEWLMHEHNSRGRLVQVRNDLVGRRLSIAPPWELLHNDSPFPASMSGRLKTDEEGRIKEIYWGGFTEKDTPTEDSASLRARKFRVPSLVISASELFDNSSVAATSRLTTLFEVIKKSDVVEFVDILDPTVIAKLSIIDFPGDSRPAIFRRSPRSLSESWLQHLPWVDTVVTDVSDLAVITKDEIDAHLQQSEAEVTSIVFEEIRSCAAVLPNLERMIFLTNRDGQPYSFEWLSGNAGESIKIELIPSEPNSTWHPSDRLIE